MAVKEKRADMKEKTRSIRIPKINCGNDCRECGQYRNIIAKNCKSFENLSLKIATILAPSSLKDAGLLP